MTYQESDATLNESEMWQAVLENDDRFDGRFVYAVRTTGIFCRPSCRSRIPKRGNVAFFPGPAAAQQAGYRPCKRCQPDAQHSPDKQLVVDLCSYIEAHIGDGPVTLQQLGDAFGLSPAHLQRVFKREVGVSPRAYADAVRRRAFKDHLREADTVTDAIFAAGYSSNSQLYARVDDHLGMEPSAYRAGGSAAIGYALSDSPLGVVLVAATERGLCAVRIGDTAEALLAELRAEFPAAQEIAPADGLGVVLAAVLQHLNGETPHYKLPLDIQATAFQQRVWQALREIPYGETRTYGEIAQTIGQPTAARAVGNACGQNPLALVIPCHRVIKGDGSYGSYRWGAARKAHLLALESEQDA